MEHAQASLTKVTRLTEFVLAKKFSDDIGPSGAVSVRELFVIASIPYVILKLLIMSLLYLFTRWCAR